MLTVIENAIVAEKRIYGKNTELEERSKTSRCGMIFNNKLAELSFYAFKTEVGTLPVQGSMLCG